VCLGLQQQQHCGQQLLEACLWVASGPRCQATWGQWQRCSNSSSSSRCVLSQAWAGALQWVLLQLQQLVLLAVLCSHLAGKVQM
jgi:hypothetical protein